MTTIGPIPNAYRLIIHDYFNTTFGTTKPLHLKQRPLMS